MQAAVNRPRFPHLLALAVPEGTAATTAELIDEASAFITQWREVVGVLTVLGRRGALGVRSNVISVGVVLVHGRERISGERSGTGKTRVRVLLIPAAGPGTLMRRQRADLMRKLMRARYVMSARVTAP